MGCHKATYPAKTQDREQDVGQLMLESRPKAPLATRPRPLEHRPQHHVGGKANEERLSRGIVLADLFDLVD